jgi:hypothetical protein
MRKAKKRPRRSKDESQGEAARSTPPSVNAVDGNGRAFLPARLGEVIAAPYPRMRSIAADIANPPELRARQQSPVKRAPRWPAYVHFEDEPGRCAAAHLLTRDEARASPR